MARTLKSSLTGIWLMQTIKMTVPLPCRIEYSVKHKGEGNNDLRVRFGNFVHLIWGQLHDFEVQPGKSKSRSMELETDMTGAEDNLQDVRWRLSRAVLTKEIDWELTYTITRLKDHTDATNGCEATITNED